MRTITRHFSGLIFCLFTYNFTLAQADTSQLTRVSIPLNRQLFHDNIDNEQKSAASFLNDSNNKNVIGLIKQTLTLRVDQLQEIIEKDSLQNHNQKLYYLRGLRMLLRNLRTSWKLKQLDPVNLPAVIDGFEECMQLDKKAISIESYIDKSGYEVAAPVVRSSAFDKNSGINAARQQLILKYCLLYPAETFSTLSTSLKNDPGLPFADSLIKVMGKRYPAQLYTYAQAGNKLGAVIRNISDDDFVKTVTLMSKSKSGQQYFPFLDNIIKGKLTIEQIDSLKDDSLQYYRLLVSTQIDYVQRTANGDTVYEFKSLTQRLSVKAKDVFVNTINGLHEKPDAIRFQCLQPLNAQELYYLAVLTDGLIYTSSYTNGVYPLMMKRIGNRGDSLLRSLHFDHYRKFISQAAAYNKLSNFLSTFQGNDAAKLMQDFVSNLEKSTGLEDGVDVADSYGSIAGTNKKLAAEVLGLVNENYQRNLKDNNKRGITIYNILYQLFLSADSSKNIDLSKELGIPPVYTVPFSSLTNDKSEVIGQVFFYGDKETRQIDFPEFQNMFKNANWSIDNTNPQWIIIRSVKGKPISIYANRPLPEETGEDDKAQQALGEYLKKNSLYPTLTIHRGHSYYANSTIDYMAASSRIVFMGSCGGFHLIDSILHKSTDAHVITSKQIGKRAVNKPFFRLLTEKLRNGSNIEWISFWNEFKSNAKVEGFEDYIPPYKNLGAIFIKAYRKAMQTE